MKRVLFVLLAGTCLTACSKNSVTQRDNILPVISLSSPADGQVFSPGQPIPVTGGITDNDRIAEVHIHVYNTANNALLMDVHLHPASSSATFSESLTAMTGINYKIQVIAIDKAVNQAYKTVEVSCN
mgnify:CR=1 FL=1